MPFDALSSFSEGQHHGAAWIAARARSVLADRAGYGKTAQAVRACDYVGASAIAWVCPPHLSVNTIREFEKWSLWPRPAHLLQDSKDEIPEKGLLVVSYDLARRPEVKKRLARRRVDFLFADEAHRLNSPGSENARAFFLKGGIASAADRLCLISASPAQNSAAEWYGFAKVVGAWSGNQNQFIDKFCVTVQTPDDPKPKIVGVKNADELKRILSPHVLCREKAPDDIRGALYEDVMTCEAGAAWHSNMSASDLMEVAQATASGNYALFDRPSVSTVRRLVGVAKAEGAARLILEALQRHEKVLAFCQYTATIDIIREVLEAAGVPLAVIDGRTPKRSRQGLVDSFQTTSIPRVFILHGRSAGEGLTLTRATRVFRVEPSWNPEDNMQMAARAWRRGQFHDVHVSDVILPGSIDEAVIGVNERKRKGLRQIDMSYNPAFLVQPEPYVYRTH